MTDTFNRTDIHNITDTFNITDIFNQTDTAILTTTTVPSGEPSCDHIPGLVSREMNRQFKEFRMWYAGIFGYVISTICSIGVVTCAMAIIVLTRKNMTFSGSIILTCLALAELMKSAFYLPHVVHSYLVLPRTRFGFPFSAPEKGWAIYTIIAFVSATTCHNISIGMTISLAAFRCVYILFPNKVPKYCSLSRSKLAVIITIFCSLAINMPTYYIYTWYKDPFTGTDIYIIYNRFGIDPIWDKLYYYVHSILMKFVPSALLIVLTTILIISMNHTLKNWQKEERRVTNMLLSVVILFAFEESFHALLILLSKLVPCFKEIFYYGLFAEVIETITFSTSIVNCLLYVSMSKRFRITFLKLFCPGCVLRNRPDWLMTTTNIGSQNHPSGGKPTGASSHRQRDASSQQRDVISHQRYANSHQQCEANGQDHGAEIYEPDHDEIDIATPGARHARGSDQHRTSVDSTSV